MEFRKMWSSENLRVDTSAAPMVERVVLACGLNPNATSADEMDAHDGKLGCLECITWTESAVLRMFGWRDAVRHAIAIHPTVEVRWCLLLPLEIATARTVDYSLGFSQNSAGVARAVWVCAMCTDTPKEPSMMQLHNIIFHIVTVHDIAEPQLNRHYFETFAAPEIYSIKPIVVVTLPLPQVESNNCQW